MNTEISVDELLTTTLSKFGLPVYNGTHPGEMLGKTDSKYFVFAYSTTGACYADDQPQAEVYVTEVHYFLPLGEKVFPRPTDIKFALRDAGFSWPETENMSDENGRHIMFVCTTVRGIVSW